MADVPQQRDVSFVNKTNKSNHPWMETCKPFRNLFCLRQPNAQITARLSDSAAHLDRGAIDFGEPIAKRI